MSFTSRWPDVYVAAGARAVSTCGDLLAATALALALQQSGAGGTAVSALLLAATVPMVFLAPLTGRMVDRVDSRRLLVVAGIVQAAVCLGLAFTHDTVAIIALVGVLGCGLAITQPTLAALLPAMVRRADLARASSISQTAVTLGSLTAPALAGVLVGGFGTRLPLLLDAVSYLSLVVAGLLLRTRRGVARTAPAPVAWRLRGDRLLTGMVVAVATVVAGVGAINVVEVFFVRDTLHGSTTVFGLISASWAAGALLGAVVAGRVARRLGDAGRIVTGVLVCLAAACAAILAGAAAWTALLLIPLWLIGGAFNGILNVLTNLAIVQRVPEVARGRAFASYASAAQGFGMAGLLGGGLLVDHFAPRMLVAAAGIAGLVAVAGCLPTVRLAIRASRAPLDHPDPAAVPHHSHPAVPDDSHPAVLDDSRPAVLDHSHPAALDHPHPAVPDRSHPAAAPDPGDSPAAPGDCPAAPGGATSSDALTSLAAGGFHGRRGRAG